MSLPVANSYFETNVSLFEVSEVLDSLPGAVNLISELLSLLYHYDGKDFDFEVPGGGVVLRGKKDRNDRRNHRKLL